MRPPIVPTLLALLALSAAAASPASAEERRVALVIGNGAYVHAPPLPNPPNDARAMAAELDRMGFEVELGLDLDNAGMSDAFRRFGREVDGADVGLFFYAGHGLQVRGRNYLVPVDAELEHESDVDWAAVPLDGVLRQVERGAKLSLIFLDACRDNPLARTLARNMGASRSAAVGRGLARIEAGLGTLIAFATAPDEVALDGEGEHSPFTEALLAHVDTRGLEVEQMLKRVTGDVAAATRGRQLPWRNSSLTEEFYFLPPEEEAPAAAAVEPAPPAPVAPPPPGGDAEIVFWQTIQGSTDPRDFEAYLSAYPEGRFAALARIRVAALAPAPEPAPTALAPAIAETPSPPTAAPAAIAVEPLNEVRVAKSDVNLRAGPGTDSPPLAVVAAGERVTVTGRARDADWYRVERPDGGGEGYIYAPLLVAPPQAPDATAAVAALTEPEPARPPRSVPTAPPPPEIRPAAPEPEPQPQPRRPQIQPEQLAALSPSLRYPAEARLRGGMTDRQIHSFPRWRDVPADGSRIRLAQADGGGGIAPDLVREARGDDVASQLAVFLSDGGEVALVQHSDLALPSHRWLDTGADSVLGGSDYLRGQGARKQGGGATNVNGFYFRYVLAVTADGRDCLGFAAVRQQDRLDGFFCRPPGERLTEADVPRLLRRIGVRGVIG